MTASTFIIADNIGKKAEEYISKAKKADKLYSERIKLGQNRISKSKASSKWKQVIEKVSAKSVQYAESFNYYPLHQFVCDNAEFTLLVKAYIGQIDDLIAFKNQNVKLLLTDAIFPEYQKRVKQLEVDLNHLQRALTIIDNDFQFVVTNLKTYERMAADYQALLDALQKLEGNAVKVVIGEETDINENNQLDSMYKLLRKDGAIQHVAGFSVFEEGSKLDKTDRDAFEAVIFYLLKNDVAQLKHLIDEGLKRFNNPKHQPGAAENHTIFDRFKQNCDAISLTCQALATAKEDYVAKMNAQLMANKAPLQNINPQQSYTPNQTIYKTPGVTSFAQATGQKQIAGTAGASLSRPQFGNG